MNTPAHINNSASFAEVYFTLRKMEGRIYPDEVVASLPNVASSDPLQKEWKIRSRSAKRLIRYLSARQRPVSILEIGCGNGWLSHQLSRISQASVIGIDINPYELQQACRVFPENPGLQFVYGELNDLDASIQFDIIVFASSIQYFSSFPAIINSCLKRLSRGGEIHILDSHFYKPAYVSQARQRSAEYFIYRGADGMKDHYFHHSITQLEEYHHRVLFDPTNFINRFFNRDPFHWITIQAAR